MTTRDEYALKLESHPRSRQGRPEHRNVHSANFAEPGFEVVNRIGGHSIKVGPGITRARWRLFDAAAVRRWLGEYAANFGAGGGDSLPDWLPRLGCERA